MLYSGAIIKAKQKCDSVSGKNHAPQKESKYSDAIIEQAVRHASMSGKNSTPKDSLNTKDSLDMVIENLFFRDKSGQLIKNPMRKNLELISKDTINIEDPQVSSNEGFNGNNANRPKMFWEQLQGNAR